MLIVCTCINNWKYSQYHLWTVGLWTNLISALYIILNFFQLPSMYMYSFYNQKIILTLFKKINLLH